MSNPRFNGRALVSTLLFLVFIVLLFSSVALYIAPHGRGPWSFLGLDKHSWVALHIVFGFLFLFVTLFHLVFNVKILLSYLRRKRPLKPETQTAAGLKPEPILALLLCLLLAIAAYANLPPASWLLAGMHASQASGNAQQGNQR
ncbi:MAG: DUF4405 domain-containing protein [Alphaproteobacteria bacterium]|nr:DUF4405 domain-containing protein [Alphaproteobacteria bacterium]